MIGRSYTLEWIWVENSLQKRHIRVENYGHLDVGSHPNQHIFRHWDEQLEAAVPAYVDDILVNKAVMSARDVAEHLRSFGLESNDPLRVTDGARVLGQLVWGERAKCRSRAWEVHPIRR